MDDYYLLTRRILRLSNLELARRNEHLKELNLTFEQSLALQFLHSHPGASIKALAAFLSVSHQTAQSLADRLEKKQLVCRTASEKDRRAVCLQMSEKGKAMTEAILSNAHETGSLLMKGFSREQQETFLHLLELAIDNLEADMK